MVARDCGVLSRIFKVELAGMKRHTRFPSDARFPPETLHVVSSSAFACRSCHTTSRVGRYRVIAARVSPGVSPLTRNIALFPGMNVLYGYFRTQATLTKVNSVNAIVVKQPHVGCFVIL